MEFNEPLCSPYWDRFKDKVRLAFLGDVTLHLLLVLGLHRRRLGATCMSCSSPTLIHLNIYHRESKPIWKIYMMEKTERSCALQHLMTFMDNILITRIPVPIGSVLLLRTSRLVCSPSLLGHRGIMGYSAYGRLMTQVAKAMNVLQCQC